MITAPFVWRTNSARCSPREQKQPILSSTIVITEHSGRRIFSASKKIKKKVKKDRFWQSSASWRATLGWFLCVCVVFLFAAARLLRASLLCKAQAFQLKHFYRQSGGRGAEMEQRSLIFFFPIANFLFLSFLFWAVWFSSVTTGKWLSLPHSYF